MSSRWLAAALLGAALVGCGARGPVGHEVAGSVKVGGAALESGSVVFNPTDPSSQGAPVQAHIAAGRYAAKVPAGKWRVTFSAGGPGDVSSSSRPEKGAAVPTIPARYREGVEVEVTGPDLGKDFDLKPK